MRVSELVDRLERAGRPDLADQVRAARAALRPTGPELSPEEIRSIRQRHGLTMRQMADMLGVSETTVSRWESGQRRPSVQRRHILTKM
ncbi:MAG: helix-turn-helix domain-containing protein [Nevskia sp.]|nr:helix-turn-helix domain-containing protein [Nevskia sp.]